VSGVRVPPPASTKALLTRGFALQRQHAPAPIWRSGNGIGNAERHRSEPARVERGHAKPRETRAAGGWIDRAVRGALVAAGRCEAPTGKPPQQRAPHFIGARFSSAYKSASAPGARPRAQRLRKPISRSEAVASRAGTQAPRSGFRSRCPAVPFRPTEQFAAHAGEGARGFSFRGRAAVSTSAPASRPQRALSAPPPRPSLSGGKGHSAGPPLGAVSCGLDNAR
jgi:hypothetical protein